MEEPVIRTGLIAAVTALTLGTQTCASPVGDGPAAAPTVPVATRPSGPPAPASPTSSSPAPTAPRGDVFSGTRKVAISMESGWPAYLVVGADGKVIGNVQLTERSVFVLVPSGARHRIKAAFADDSCVGVQRHADGPPTLVVADCDPAAQGQLFRFVRTEERDSQGRRNYRVVTADGPLTFDSFHGLHVDDRSQGGPVTGFAVSDQGPA
ncbi:hypothetical protein V6V47_18460 [Micromonospora sp. CPCC 205539]|uniref:hypothetical protein n=1 Tax=Micromonospora sp. CPCC 205539 TaxID=3122408 RepID=UPI002FF42697